MSARRLSPLHRTNIRPTRRWSPYQLGFDQDPYWANVKLLVPFVGEHNSTSIIDVRGNTLTANGNAKLDFSESFFGRSSGIFDGSGDHIVLPTSTDFDVGSSDMTLEMWVKSTQASGVSYPSLFAREWGGSPYTGGISWFFNSGGSGAMQIWCADYSTGGAMMTADNTNYRDGNWHHLAWTKYGSVHTLWQDGVQVSTRTNAFSLATVSKNFTLGDDLTFGPRGYNGRMAWLRWTIGTARYTSAFTRPSAPFPDC